MNFNRGKAQISLATNIVIISMCMLFATLFMGYAVYRNSAPVWPPYGVEKPSLFLPLLSTLFLFVSSFFCHKTSAYVKKLDFKSSHFHLNITIILGVLFMISQIFLWQQMRENGLYVNSGVFASLTYAFTWIHFAHMVLGILALFYLKKALRPKTSHLEAKTSSVENFWYFLEIIWLIMFVTLFVF